MVHGGSWLVPEVGGEDYLRKPPGINWIIAASFALTGRQDELAARLPTVLFFLAFVSLLIWMPGGFLDRRGRLAAAVVFLTTGVMMEKGRLIEIDQAEPLTASFQVDINTADKPELNQLPGIGDTRARRIIETRQTAGPFAEPDELRNVKGIGPKTMERIRPYLPPLPKEKKRNE